MVLLIRLIIIFLCSLLAAVLKKSKKNLVIWLYNKFSNEKSIDPKKTQMESTFKSKEHLPEFKEILCPKNSKPLSSDSCKNCSDKKTLERKHQSGKKLIAIICTWEINDRST